MAIVPKIFCDPEGWTQLKNVRRQYVFLENWKGNATVLRQISNSWNFLTVAVGQFH